MTNNELDMSSIKMNEEWKKINRKNSAKGYLNAHRRKETNHGRVE